MNYLNDLKHHYRPKKGWVNDPNGLCWFGGYYHVFYQHCPNCETPDEPMCWGHARTKDFITWEELPIALAPDMPYDKGGCWSGTAIEKDGVLYLYYASVVKDGKVIAYPAEEVRHLLKDSDPAVKIIQNGFIIPRNGRTPVTYKGEIRDLKILRDECFLEVFVNGGEEIYSVLL